jgi:hypothetical protein
MSMLVPGLLLTELQQCRYYKYKKVPTIGLWRWYINVTLTILDIIHRPVFISNSTQLYRFVRTSQETHYVSVTSPTG